MPLKEKILHPFLIAIFPIIYLYSQTINEVPPQQMVLPLILMLVITTVLVFTVKFIFKDWKKSALIVSLILILFILYSPVFAHFNGPASDDPGIGRHRYLVPIFTIPLIIISYLILRTKIKLNNITIILNTVAISLIIISTVNIGDYILQPKNDDNANNIEMTSDKNSKPDIYFILLDAYSGEKVLKKYYNFDNHDFINSLREKGFFVPDESYSNYHNTIPSLGATFNMMYLDNNFERKDIFAMFPESSVVKILKSNGYKIIDFQKHSVTFDIPAVDRTLCKKESNRYTDTRLMDQLIKYTPLSALIVIVPPEQDMDSQLCLFAELSNTQDMFDEPTFVFAHSLVTHSPYFYGPNGEAITPIIDNEHYLYAVKFANNKMIQIVDKLLNTKNPPIIIISGDHGTPLLDDKFTDQEKTIMYHQNLYAIYLPGGDYSLVEKTRTPVNTFRIIFDQFFNMNYELLEDKTFSSPTGEWYILNETTDITIKHGMG